MPTVARAEAALGTASRATAVITGRSRRIGSIDPFQHEKFRPRGAVGAPLHPTGARRALLDRVPARPDGPVDVDEAGVEREAGRGAVELVDVEPLDPAVLLGEREHAPDRPGRAAGGVGGGCAELDGPPPLRPAPPPR